MMGGCASNKNFVERGMVQEIINEEPQIICVFSMYKDGAPLVWTKDFVLE